MGLKSDKNDWPVISKFSLRIIGDPLSKRLQENIFDNKFNFYKDNVPLIQGYLKSDLVLHVE